MKFKNLKTFIKTIIGFLIYYFLPRKKIVLILSSMRSGSTLLKALLGEAKDVSHINEFNFNRKINKYAIYFDIYLLAKEKIIVLKNPASFNNFHQYSTNHFRLPHKNIILIRNPVDTIISLLNMNIKTNQSISPPQLINYWTKTYKNLQKEMNQNVLIVRYEDLIKKPIEITKTAYNFIESQKEDGTSTYRKPISGKWEWGIDDGGEIIKQMKVVEYKKDYSKYDYWIKRIKDYNEIMELVHFFDLKMPV